nr:MAG TPA: hypothetical protein [Caudoviricetes sp.]
MHFILLSYSFSGIIYFYRVFVKYFYIVFVFFYYFLYGNNIKKCDGNIVALFFRKGCGARQDFSRYEILKG